jgi:glycosyltransferase involved in cell wall biosynthesis
MSGPKSDLRRITVDLTPLLPGGANGGAAVVAIELVRELATLTPRIRYRLLTHHQTHAELAQLDAPNVERVCVVHQSCSRGRGRVAGSTVHRLGRALIDSLLPVAARVRVKNSYRKIRYRREHQQTTAYSNSDLLFCPFTAPFYYDPRVPLVAIIHDLQHLTYPEFFGVEQRTYRQQHVIDACRRAARVVCISEYVRKTLLESVSIPGERAVTIYHALLQRLAVCSDAEHDSVMGRLGVRKGRFLLYPANFWPHKNHRALIDAYREFKSDCPSSELRVVCTGAPDARMRGVAEYADAQAPGGFVFAGYVPESELSTLYTSCAGLVFPSLYEGFGMPVLEAMARGKLVVCSNVTSLPEVVGDAGALFDPSNVRQLSELIAAIEHKSPWLADVARRGPARAQRFGTAANMAQRYLSLFERVRYDWVNAGSVC